jgi:threonine/homoserine/homoserine lactone efflux protein
MTPETLAALAAFALVTSVTPGPNNMMLLASGANFGFRRTVPHMLGISLGHAVMVAGVGLGIMALFERFPLAQRALTVVSVACMLWLAWRIATAAPPAPGKPGGRPLTFLQAAAFQWVNPKAWAMALGAITLYAPARDPAAVGAVAAVFATVNLPSVGLWAAAGQGLRGWLAEPARLRAFNWTMAALLVASLAVIL